MKLITLTALIAVIFIFSCQNKQSGEIESLNRKAQIFTNSEKTITDNETFIADSSAKPESPGSGSQDKKQPAGDPVNKPDWDKKIIKTASLQLEVKDYNGYYTSLREKVGNLGGYIAQEQQTQSDYKIENSISIKIPVDKFDNAVVQLTGNVEKIVEKRISSQDVTMEVVDVKSRMEAKKKVRQRYMDLLGQAKNMEEILRVQSEINGIQVEIESGEGRVQYLTHSSVFSTIQLTYYQVLNSSAIEKDTKPSFGQKLVEGLKTGWSMVSELFIGIVTIWPLLLLTLFIVILYKKFIYKTPESGSV